MTNLSSRVEGAVVRATFREMLPFIIVLHLWINTTVPFVDRRNGEVKTVHVCFSYMLNFIDRHEQHYIMVCKQAVKPIVNP